MSESEQKTKRKRRWLRFSLRAFLIVVTLLGIWFAWFVHRVEQQKRAVNWARENSGEVFYDYFEVDAAGHFVEDCRPPGPKWLQDILGVDYFASVDFVNLSCSEVENVNPIGSLASLKALDLSSTQVTDLTPLAGLTNLEILDLYFTPVTDLKSLMSLSKLKELRLRGTNVSDLTPLAALKNLEILLLDYEETNEEAIQKLRQALPNCEIYEFYEEGF